MTSSYDVLAAIHMQRVAGHPVLSVAGAGARQNAAMDIAR
jgi:hypothetical protein